jgi:8-oxo-dGTP pyrophosphatase MutT (NUDIX family)
MERKTEAKAVPPSRTGAPPGRGGVRLPARAVARVGASADRPAVPTKTSIGVILCRINQKTGRPEVLLVKKRYTYAYVEFIHGRYSSRHCNSRQVSRTVQGLLDQMTTDELLDIWSLNFAHMWYRIWLTREQRDFYNKKYSKFYSTFIRGDGGIALRAALRKARRSGALLWDIPKGHPHAHARESDLSCAVRELGEETGIGKNEYTILPGIKRSVSFVSGGTRYNSTYYVAAAHARLTASNGDGGHLALRSIEDMGEVGEARWHDIERLRLLDGETPRFENLVAPAFAAVKQYHHPAGLARGAPRALASLAAVVAMAAAIPVPPPRKSVGWGVGAPPANTGRGPADGTNALLPGSGDDAGDGWRPAKSRSLRRKMRRQHAAAQVRRLPQS